MSATGGHHANLSCSFCGKSQRDVKKLIAGPTVYICYGCIVICHGVIAEQAAMEVGDADLNALRDIARQLAKLLHAIPSASALSERARALALGIDAAAAAEQA